MDLPAFAPSPPSLFRKTGILFAFLNSVILLLFLAVKIFSDVIPANIDVRLPIIVSLAMGMILFLVSAFNDSLAWIQPLLLLFSTPLPMIYHASSMFSLGSFIAAEILLFRLGFFERSRLAKFLITIAYFFLSEILVGLYHKLPPVDIALPILYTTFFLAFLLFVYGDKWIVYLKEPKPTLSLAELKVTAKEAEYLRALLEGRSIKEIAIDTGVTESTVRNTLARVYRKFNVQDKAALMAKCGGFALID
jgi:DNA-binding CsgD family transcriptional regulator